MSRLGINLNRGLLQRVSLLSAFGCLLVGHARAGVNRWTAIGPDGANVLALAIDPGTPSTVFAGTSGSGVLKSTDSGATWAAANRGLATFNVRALAIDPSTPSTLYAGTDAGVFKSTAGGQSWAPANDGLDAQPQVAVNALAIVPGSPGTMYAGTSRGVFKSVNGASSWTTTGAGGAQSRLAARLITIDPTSPSTLYVGVEDENGPGLYKSTNAGDSWSLIYTPVDPSDPVDFGPSVTALVIDPRPPSRLYMALAGGGLLASEDRGVTWSHTSCPENNLLSLTFDPASFATIYVGTGEGAVLRTDDSGGHWTPLTDGPLASMVNTVTIAPSDPATLYVGGDDGLFRSADAGRTWARSRLGVNSSGASRLAVNPDAPSTIYLVSNAGRGIVTKTTDGGAEWTDSSRGLSGRWVSALVIDPASPSTLYAGLWSAFEGASVYKSTDGGAHWTPAFSGMPPSNVWALKIARSRPSTLYAGEDFYGVFKSTDAGSAWIPVNIGLTAVGPYVRALAVDPATADTVYAATPPTGRPDTNTKIFKSTDGAANWRQLPIALPAGTSLTVLAIDASAPSTIYAAYDASFTAIREAGVSKSIDGGETWIAPQNLLPAETVSALVVDPASPRNIYAATSAGIFRSTDGAVSWTPFNSGLQSLLVSDLWIDRTGMLLRAATADGLFEYRASNGFPCAVGPENLCFLGGRFEATLEATDPRTGKAGVGHAISQGDRFGYFSLPAFTSDPTLPEVFVKMADATSLPAPAGGSFWVFYNGLTDLHYRLTVFDTMTGTERSYENDPVNPYCGGADTSAFPGTGATPSRSARVASTLVSAEDALYLLDRQFRVSLIAQDPRTGILAPGQAIPQADGFGYFSLPTFTGDPTFPEVFVKMIGGTAFPPPNGPFWFFHSGLTDLAYTLTVTDTVTGAVRIYQNGTGNSSRLCGGADTTAFPPSPRTFGRWEVWGRVFGNSPDRPLIGARVEVTEGRFAGRYAVVSETGGVSGGVGYVITDLDPILRGVPAGTVTLRASQPGYQDQTMTAQLCLLGPVLEEECNNDFYLQPATPSAGNAVWGDVGGVKYSGPLIGARVQVLDGPSAGVSVVVTANGNIERGSGYVIQGLPAGSVSLRASMPGYQDQTRTVTVPISCSIALALEECGVYFGLTPAN